MEILVKKWGNSLGIRIPKIIANDLSLKDGLKVKIEDKNGSIIISPVSNSLNELLAQITPENIHSEIKSGNPVGNEAW
jgi:antitoxin MazE